MHQESYRPEGLLQLHAIQEVDELINAYFKPETLTNNYMLLDKYKKHIQRQVLFAWKGGKNASLLVQKEGFYRLYYFLNDTTEAFLPSTAEDIVMEVLFRGPKQFPDKEVDYWEQQGFVKHLQRDAYVLPVPKIDLSDEPLVSRGVSIELAQGPEAVRFVKSSMEQDLDHYTGDMLSLSEIESHCHNEDVWIVKVEEQPAGFLQANLKNKIYWLEHIVVDQKCRGRGLSKLLMHSFFQQGIAKDCRSFQLWVINENHAAVSLYHKYGFQYINKSTISLLKRNHA